MSNALERLADSIRRIPYTRENFGQALTELLFVFVFGFMPIWLGMLFAWLSPEAKIGKFLGGFFSSGEALLMSAALMGPLIYILFKRYGDLPNNLSLRFPYGWFYVLIIFFICAIAASVFGYSSATQGENRIINQNMQILSIFVLTISFVVLVLVSTIRNYMEGGAANIMVNDTAEFLEDWDDS